MAQFSGIVGPHVYSTVFGPGYHVSYIICLCFLIVGIVAILASWVLVRRKDRKRGAEVSLQA
jgi:ABC-type Fe3+-siderophore transport system permease subunit